MTGIAAILQKRQGTSNVTQILDEMYTRGSVIRSERVIRDDTEIEIGLCTHPNEHKALESKEGEIFAIDGSSFDYLITKRLEHDAGLVSLQALIDSPGAFAFLATYSGSLLVARDPIGQKPLYYGTKPTHEFACASLRHPLEQNGFQNVAPVPPGKLLTVVNGQLSEVFSRTLHDSREELKISEEMVLKELKALFQNAVSETVPMRSMIAFSGGLDSSLIAIQAKLSQLEPDLVTVGLKGQTELVHASKVAEKLGLKIHIRELSKADILAAVDHVAEIIESEDPVLLGISIPLYFACESASSFGHEVIVMGQLSDELFGGYGRFERLANDRQFDEARQEIERSVHEASVKDFDPGDKLATSFRLKLRCPYAYLPLVEYGLKIPIRLKLHVSERGVERKHILRKLAQMIGLPEEVSNRPKKAVQYSSGVQRVLVTEATSRGLTVRSFIRSLRKQSLENKASVPLHNR